MWGANVVATLIGIAITAEISSFSSLCCSCLYPSNRLIISAYCPYTTTPTLLNVSALTDLSTNPQNEQSLTLMEYIVCIAPFTFP